MYGSHNRERSARRERDAAPSAQPARPEPRAEAVLQLQRSAGNHAVSGLLQRQDHEGEGAVPVAEPAPQQVAMLSPEAEREATELLGQRRERQRVIDVIVNDLVASGNIDPALLRGGRVTYSSAVSGEGESEPPGYRRDADTGEREARSTRVRIGPAAFGRGLPWLVTSIMHEYQHVLQFQTDGESVVPGQAPRRALILQQDVEAYAWELINAEQTGLAANPRQIRETWARCHDNWSRLGDPGRRPLADLYERAHAAAEAAVGAELRNFRPLAAR